MADAFSQEFESFLGKHSLTDVIDQLACLGFRSVNDLKEVDESTLDSMKQSGVRLTFLQRQRLLSAAKEAKGVKAVSPRASSPSEGGALTTPSPLEKEWAEFEWLSETAVLLVEHNAKHEFLFNPGAMDILKKVTGKIYSFGIVGKYRSGKSFILNEFLGGKCGFDLGHTTQSCTKGVWMWGKVRKNGDALIAFDTEGLFDTENRSPDADSKLFCLSLLLSNYVIINQTTCLDEAGLRQLGFVRDLTKSIITSDGPNDGKDFQHHFPGLMWLIRDFKLRFKQKEDGTRQDANEYLAEALTEKAEDTFDADTRNANVIRKIIKESFMPRDCRTLVFPLKESDDSEDEDDDLLSRIGTPQAKYQKKFIKGVAEVKDLVYRRAMASSKRIKVWEAGIEKHKSLNGEEFGSIVHQICKDMNSGRAPAIPNLWETIKTKAVEEGVARAEAVYKEIMDQLALPMSVVDLDEANMNALSAGMKVFVESIAREEGGEKFQKLVSGDGSSSGLASHYGDENAKKSFDLCRNKLLELWGPIGEKADRNAYKSIDEYNADTSTAAEALQAACVGPHAEGTLKEFARNREEKQKFVMTQLQLSEVIREKEQAALRAENAAAETKRLQRKLEEETHLVEMERKLQAEQAAEQKLMFERERKQMAQEYERKMEDMRVARENQDVVAREIQSLKMQLNNMMNAPPPAYHMVEVSHPATRTIQQRQRCGAVTLKGTPCKNSVNCPHHS